jgi:hypothetical protein
VEREPTLDFILRYGILERSANKLAVISFNLVAPFEDFCRFVLAGLAEIVLRVVVEARLGTHIPVPPDEQR